jgi:hypothetical protein
LADL